MTEQRGWRGNGSASPPPPPPPQIFKEQLTLSISTKGRRLCQTLYCSTPQIFRPSAIPASCLSSLAILHRFPSYQLRIGTSSFFEYFLKEHVLVVLDNFFLSYQVLIIKTIVYLLCRYRIKGYCQIHITPSYACQKTT